VWLCTEEYITVKNDTLNSTLAHKNGHAAVPEFYIVSVNGVTYLAATGSPIDAVVLLAEQHGVGTHPADWTDMTEDMFSELKFSQGVLDPRINYLQFVSRYRHAGSFLEVVEVVDDCDSTSG
jgi:hypothetical protein